jgi:hypothetical protein
MLQLPPLILATVMSFLISHTEAQLLGCASLKCPKQHDQDYCPIGNSTLSSIGTLEFTTTLSTQPLTWTIGFQEIPQPANEDGSCTSKARRLKARSENEGPRMIRSRKCVNEKPLYSQYRNYYLGTLAGGKDGVFGELGCALFFEGISGDLKFPGTSAPSDSGTCNDALTRSCVADLMEQTKSESEKLVANGKTGCGDLQAALQDKAPGSCTVAKGGKWGVVYARGSLPLWFMFLSLVTN